MFGFAKSSFDRANRGDITQIVGVFSRRLQDRRLLTEFRVREQRAKAFEADLPFADMPMTIAIAAERNLRIVEMKEVHTVEPDVLLREIDEAIHSGLTVDLVPGRPCVCGVEADPELRMIDRLDETPEFFDRAACEASRAR